MIARVIGRSEDILYFAAGAGGLDHVFPDVMSRWVITATDRIAEYAVEQPSPDRLIVALELIEAEVAQFARDAVRAAIVRGLEEHGLRVPQFEIRTAPGAIVRGEGRFERFRRGFTPVGDGRYPWRVELRELDGDDRPDLVIRTSG